MGVNFKSKVPTFSVVLSSIFVLESQSIALSFAGTLYIASFSTCMTPE